MPKNKIVSINQSREDGLPSNLIPLDSKKMVRIPVVDRFYEIDGEIYYQISGDNTPRKWADYDLKDFN
ncbi:hypothetical protein [Sporosarcina sp. FSL W7-1283]|uniref:hypothetical protein n=1 Tax=Sporosarcina sp. FSL W7-1283 TaxID=2921560 RepID=UPI0030F64E6C